MRIEKTPGGAIILVVSRRNLNTLLAKLDGFPVESACTIGAPSIYDPPMFLKAEEDEVHYSHSSRKGLGAETMHPYTEMVLEPIGEADANNSGETTETEKGTD